MVALILKLANGLRQPITRDSEVSLLESVLLSDTQLWKAARSAWHRLFIAGLLMDPDAKRDFATVRSAVKRAFYRHSDTLLPILDLYEALRTAYVRLHLGRSRPFAQRDVVVGSAVHRTDASAILNGTS